MKKKAFTEPVCFEIVNKYNLRNLKNTKYKILKELGKTGKIFIKKIFF